MSNYYKYKTENKNITFTEAFFLSVGFSIAALLFSYGVVILLTGSGVLLGGIAVIISMLPLHLSMSEIIQKVR